jgi:ATP phosphoribosyltransferase
MLDNGDADLQIILPSDGNLHQPTREFLQSCNLGVERSSSRTYTGSIPNLINTKVLFQRAADITSKIEEGSAELGITGLDRFLEYQRHASDSTIAIDDLGFGGCKLVLAVPTSWLDITTIEDLADLALEFRENKKQLKIATKYPRLISKYFLENGIEYFSLVTTSGTLEAAPVAGYADIIGDLMATGETLRENKLKPLSSPAILSSQACLIANRKLLRVKPDTLGQVKVILEMMEGYIRSKQYHRISANIQGESEKATVTKILERPNLAGLQGPTISRMYNVNGNTSYSITIVVNQGVLLEVIDHLRKLGATDITTSDVNYMFKDKSYAYAKLLSQLEN